MKIPAPVIARSLRAIDADWKLAHTESHSRRTTVLQISAADGIERELVLQTHGVRDRQRNPHMARDEFRLLAALQKSILPTAQPLHLNTTHEPPFFILARLPGAVQPAANAQTLAESLQAIHAVDWRRLDLDFLPQVDALLASDLDTYEGDPLPIRSALRSSLPKLVVNPPALLHGDFWLGNLLWAGGRSTGIIDWEDAMLGDPLADLGKSRLEMLWSLGEAAMKRYTVAYLALNPALDASALPFWDLWGALRLSHFADFAADAKSASRMRLQYQRFYEAALREIA
ncbi:MAG: phosphotransferase [Chloroflexi bacterium]|nr:phosphotransferase [Chloroflexota bacterium]